MMRRRSHEARDGVKMPRPALMAGLLFLVAAGQAAELTATRLRLTPDITASLRGATFSDQDVVSVGPGAAGSLSPALAQALPARVGINALLVAGGSLVFAPDVPFVAGTNAFTARDLVAYHVNGGTFTPFFRGALAGIPERARIDAAAWLPESGRLLLSFDITITLAPFGPVQDEDIVTFQGETAVALLAGRTLGIPAGADLDALYHDGTCLYFSLDLTATLGGVTGTRRDVWQCRTNPLAVSLISGIGLDDRADLVALDAPIDADGDWLSDFEELTGRDDPATTLPGSVLALTPGGFVSDPAVADSDRDGATDGQEALAGTEPADPASCLRLTRVGPSGAGSRVAWSSVPGRRYILESAVRPDLPFGVLAGGLVAVGPSMGHTNAAGGPMAVYRIRLDP